jgi:hypothetical protein
VEEPLFSISGKDVVNRQIAYREFLKNFDARKESSILQI